MTTSTGDQRARITAAIADLWDAAGIEPQLDRPRIIPLDKLWQGFPLAVDEVNGLTRASARLHLTALSGQVIEQPKRKADSPLAGYLYAYPYLTQVQGYILVEQADIVERRRFSVAHEIGHYLLHFLPKIAEFQRQGQHIHATEELVYGEKAVGKDPDIPTGTVAYARSGVANLAIDEWELQRMEVEANQFAADLLMPEPACMTLLARFGTRASPRRLATEFLVSPAAMRVRLKSLGVAIE